MEAIKREEKNFSLTYNEQKYSHVILSAPPCRSIDKTLSEAKVGTKMRNCK